MTKSIVTGGVMLVALAALVMGLTDVLALSNAGIVSWAAVGAVATILFGAFGGFKPFFYSGSPLDDDGNGGGESPLEALEGQRQSIARKLVTVGAEDEDGRPLFDDRAPIVSQPSNDSPPTFNPDAQIASANDQPNHPLFGQALREQLDSDRVPGDHTDNPPEALEASPIETTPEPANPPPLISEAAPWVAARNAQIDEDTGSVPTIDDAGSVPTIDVEESPSWMTSTDSEEIDADVLTAEHDTVRDGEDLVEADHSVDHRSGPEDAPEPDTSDERPGATEVSTSSEDAEHEDDESEDDAESVTPTIEDHESEDDAESVTPTIEEDESEDDAESVTPTIEDVHGDLPAEESEIAGSAEVSIESDDDDISEASGDDLVVTTGHGDQLPVVMKSPSALEIQKYSPTEILAVVRAQESELVDTLIGEGVLTTSGPITDKDVRTMLFVAVSSNELIDVLTEASGDSPELRSSGKSALPKG